MISKLGVFRLWLVILKGAPLIFYVILTTLRGRERERGRWKEAKTKKKSLYKPNWSRFTACNLLLRAAHTDMHKALEIQFHEKWSWGRKPKISLTENQNKLQTKSWSTPFACKIWRNDDDDNNVIVDGYIKNVITSTSIIQSFSICYVHRE